MYILLCCDYNLQIVNTRFPNETLHEDKQKQHFTASESIQSCGVSVSGCCDLRQWVCASEEMSSHVMKYASTKQVRRESGGRSRTLRSASK